MAGERRVRLRPPLPADPLELEVHATRDRVITPRLRSTGQWEPYESTLVQSLLGPGDVFVDVGANIGYFSVLAAERVGGAGQVFAFEPDPENYGLLAANLALNGFGPRAHTVCAALAEADGEGALYLSEDNLGDHQVFAVADNRHHIPIRLLDGGKYLAARVARVDLLKVDTQGAEHAVLSGLLPFLLGRPSLRVLVELTPLSLRQAGASGRRLVALLAQLELPFWIVDHLRHRLVATDAEALSVWCDNVDAVPGDAGFMNILLGPAPD